MLSPRKYAEAIGKPYSTVMTWLQGGQIPQAIKHPTPTGHFWEIPDDAPPPELKPGPKPGTKRSNSKGQAAPARKRANKKGA